jgi:glycosyltransferase involved in cell wall biosynthesis
MSTSVVIATYDLARLGDLLAAVDSVQRQTVAPAEVIVAVDRNPQLLARISAELRSVVVLANVEHAGAGGARNSGAAVATGDYLAFLDDDAIAAPDWIERIEAAFDQDSVIGVGGLIEPRWQSEPPRWFPLEFGWVVGCSYTGLPGERAAVRNVIAANMAMRRDRFEAVGGFRHGYGKRGRRSEPEETDLCIRAGRRWQEQMWLYDPAIRVQHDVPASRCRFGYFVRRCRDEGIGKASLAGLVGTDDALTEERAFVRRVLPRGIATGLGDLLLRGETGGLLRAGAIVVGSGVTAAGYASGRGKARLAVRPVTPLEAEAAS